MSEDEDPPADPPAWAPIRGAPEGAEVPPFPVGPEPPDSPAPKPKRSRSRALTITIPEPVHSVHSARSPNEIALEIGRHRRRAEYGAKLALEEWVEIGRCMKALYDECGYRGAQYVDFALAHAGVSTKEDAHRLYLLGHEGDKILALCEAEAAVKANYQWPHWRTVVKELKREQDRRERRLDDEPERDPEAEPEPESPLDAMTRKCSDLDAQLQAATQQMRNERALKEEALEEVEPLRKQIEERDRWIEQLTKAAIERDRLQLADEMLRLNGRPLPDGATCRCFFCDRTDLDVIMMVAGRGGAVMCDWCIADAMMIDDGEKDAEGRAAILDIELYRRDEFGRSPSEIPDDDEPDEPKQLESEVEPEPEPGDEPADEPAVASPVDEKELRRRAALLVELYGEPDSDEAAAAEELAAYLRLPRPLYPEEKAQAKKMATNLKRRHKRAASK